MIKAAPMRALRFRPAFPPPSPSSRFLRRSARYVSTASETATNTRSFATRTKNLVYGTLLTVGLGFGYLYVTDTRAGIHEWLAVPALRVIYADGEDAHHAGTKLLRGLYDFGIHPRERGNPDAAGDLEVELFGHVLRNPIGTSAGIDKGAEVPTPLLALGPAIVEVGAVTPYPQEGNPKPRVFRLPSQNALINRYGFNSEGAEVVAMRLRQRVREFAYHMGFGIDEDAERAVLDGQAGVPPGSLMSGRLMAVQVTKNKGTPETDIEAVKRDYAFCVQHVGKYADIIVVNVSSPNTPGLRTLQNVEPLTQLLAGVVDAVAKVDRRVKPAIMVKVSPDEDSDEQLAGICEAVWDTGVDGIIVGNTTKKRPDPIPKGYIMPAKEANILLEQGGYSGPQLFDKTLSLVKRYRTMLDNGPRLPANTPSEESKPSSNPSQETNNPVSRPATGDEPDASLLSKLDPNDQTTKAAAAAVSLAVPGMPSGTADSPSDLPSNVDDLSASAPTVSVKKTVPEADAAPAPSTGGSRKVLFATGGITNGRQAREILDAGASVAMVYTALIYGGVGTISRIKEEMREEAKKGR